MRGIAEFAMRSRFHSMGLAAVLAMLNIGILPAIVASLVILRKGVSEGLMVTGVALIPLAIHYSGFADPGPMLSLLGVSLLAVILRLSMSWELVLIAAVIVPLVAGLTNMLASEQAIAFGAELYKSLVGGPADLPIDMDEATYNQLLSDMVIGRIASMLGYLMVAALIVARWCQAMLYNPGGFQSEFHQLRLNQWTSMVIAILVLIAAALGESMYTRWLLLLMVPLTISALGLVHWMVAQGKIPKAVLWPLYICLLLMDQLTAPMLGFVAMLDSWVGLRKFRSDREV